MVDLANVVIFDPNTASLYEAKGLVMTMNGNALQLTLPRADGGDPLTPIARTEQPKKKRSSAYTRRYKANFKKVASRFKMKSGKWKKNGFKSAVKLAHKMSKK